MEGSKGYQEHNWDLTKLLGNAVSQGVSQRSRSDVGPVLTAPSETPGHNTTGESQSRHAQQPAVKNKEEIHLLK